MRNEFDLLVIGGGIVGLAAAYCISERYPDMQIGILEKENNVAAHQTGHNSGVIHSGVYYKPESLKAKNSISGREKLIAFARENDVPHDICGKVIVAAEDSEIPSLEKIYYTGLANGLNEIRLIDAKELVEIEPFCKGVKAISVPYAGIIDYVRFCEILANKITSKPNRSILFNQKVISIRRDNKMYCIQTVENKFYSKYLIVCGGLQSDRLALMEGLKISARIVPFRGDYYKLISDFKVRGLIYPVPDLNFPFLGVHFTRMIRGGVECGPNAVFSFKREGYGKTDFDFSDTISALSFVGTQIFFQRHLGMGLTEFRRAFSKRLFLGSLKRLLPDLQPNEIVPYGAGVRAAALNENGALVDDFLYAEGEGSIHVLNAPSPAATACLAIAEDILNKFETKI